MTPAPPSAADLQSVGLDPTWSRHLRVPSHDGGTHTWHLLDRPGTDAGGTTVLCVHGNPTSSVLWSRLLRELDPGLRVLAPDLLSMGWSERVGARRYRDRVTDLVDLLDALDVTGPVWVVAQDWGGAIAMGLAVHHPERVAGLVLSNTGIAVPADRHAPWLIRTAASAGLHRLVTRTTPLFVRATPLLPGGRPDRATRRLLAQPYRSADDRAGVAGFVADVPFSERHPSAADLAFVADRLGDMRVPVHLVWGARDPVFDDSFADDLLGRFADADLHRFPRAGHLAVLVEQIAPLVSDTVGATDRAPVVAPAVEGVVALRPLWAEIADRANSRRLAVVDLANDREVTDAEFSHLVDTMAYRLRTIGVRPGERVAVVVPPSVEFLAAIYACWRIGAVVVAVDRALGVRGMGAALRSARPQHVVGIPKALAATRLLRWAPGARLVPVRSLLDNNRARTNGADRNAAADAAVDITVDVTVEVTVEPDAEAAVVFTSGATGPSKGVRYSHRQLCEQRDALRRQYSIGDQDRFVAAFAPFAVFGPALGITTCFADMDVTAPATLTATALDEACRRSQATMVFASPAALANVLATATGPLPALAAVRLVLSAGAPVPLRTLQGIARLCPSAAAHTPYGMTEVLPVADVSLTERERIGAGRGVCVGRPVPGCEVRIADPDVTDELVWLLGGATGEVVIRAPWCSLGYDRLASTQRRARQIDHSNGDPTPWHRSGDVGHVDDDGNLWIEGRVVHLVHTVGGAITPVPVEVAVETVAGVRRAAVVGVGPRGIQQVVIVVEHESQRDGLAPDDVATLVRAAAHPVPIAAVWCLRQLPVDQRHNAKIDRTALARQMTIATSGGRA